MAAHGIDRSGGSGGAGAPSILSAFNELADPNANAVPYWDDAAGAFAWAMPASNATTAKQALLLDKHGADIASAATVNLDTSTGNLIDITGSVTITAITLAEGVEKTLRLTGAPLITDGASLVCPGATNIQGFAGDTFKARGYAAGVVRLFGYQSFESSLPGKIVTAKGDILVATVARTLARKAVGADGTVPMARSADTSGLAYVASLTKVIYGFTYANNAGDATNDLDIAAGGAMDATGAYWITGSALTKQSDVVWAVGSAAGALDTGAVGNSDYYIWAIARSDTGVVDYLFSLSSTAPTMPTNYDFKRLIGWFKRVGGTIVAFHTYETEGGGIEMNWDVPTLDINLAATLTTSRRTDAVKVPLNFSTVANLTIGVSDATVNTAARIMCPDEVDAAVGINNANMFVTNTTSVLEASQMQVRTSAAGLIAARSDTATIDSYTVRTSGFTWARRN